MSMYFWHAQAADAETRGNSKDAHPLGLLLFGDSVDFRFVKYFCQSALGQEPSAFTVFDSGSEWLKLQGEKLVHSFALRLSVYPQQCHMFLALLMLQDVARMIAGMVWMLLS